MSRTYKKYVANELSFESIKELKHKENVARKMKIVNEVRLLKSQGLSVREISRRIGLNRRTVSNYLNEKFQPVHALYGTKKYGILSPFMNEINCMLEQGATGKYIEDRIGEKGYKSSSSSVWHYISNWKQRRNTTV